MKKDRRLVAAGLTVAAITLIGLAIALWPAPTPQPLQVAADPNSEPQRHAQQAREAELKARFEQAVTMLHAKQYDYAIKALHRVLELAPKLPEAHVNMGYALLGKGEYAAAADFFNTATELKPQQANAYYGLAIAYEGEQELELALGAMRSYIHLSRQDDPYLAKARAALWEWEAALKEEKAAAGKTRPTSGSATQNHH
ncbi:MAG TPA: tetratricopeptide repeat protein [Gammaproteobacteria bacterium]